MTYSRTIELCFVGEGLGIRHAFPTPVLRFHVYGHQELNARLLEQVALRRQEDCGKAQSNVGGWHSRDAFLDWPGNEVALLRDCFGKASLEIMERSLAGNTTRPCAAKLSMQAWVTVLERGGYNRLHVHPGCHWSGVYWVQIGPQGKDAENGVLELADPRPGASMIENAGMPFGKLVKVEPVAGEGVVFPSWLPHGVTSVTDDIPRVSVAFNAKVLSWDSPTSG